MIYKACVLWSKLSPGEWGCLGLACWLQQLGFFGWLTVGLGTCLPPSYVSLKWKVGLLSRPTSWLLSFFGIFHIPAWGPVLSPGSLQYNYHTLSSNMYVTRSINIPTKKGRSFFSILLVNLQWLEDCINWFDLELQVAVKSWGLPSLWKGVGLHFKTNRMNHKRKGTSSRQLICKGLIQKFKGRSGGWIKATGGKLVNSNGREGFCPSSGRSCFVVKGDENRDAGMLSCCCCFQLSECASNWKMKNRLSYMKWWSAKVRE